MASNPTVRVGVLLLEAVQLLDLSSIDLLNMISQSYLANIPFPEPLKAGAVPMEILYVNEAGPNKLHKCTANVEMRVDASISDKICAPPKKGGEKTLDILLIPGPDPWAYKPTDALNGFIKGHFDSGTDLLVICTGAYPAGYAGILNGRKATGPKLVLPELRTKFPEAELEDGEKRWISDGNLWSSGMSCFPPSAPTCTSWDRHRNESQLTTAKRWHHERTGYGCRVHS